MLNVGEEVKESERAGLQLHNVHACTSYLQCLPWHSLKAAISQEGGRHLSEGSQFSRHVWHPNFNEINTLSLSPQPANHSLWNWNQGAGSQEGLTGTTAGWGNSTLPAWHPFKGVIREDSWTCSECMSWQANVVIVPSLTYLVAINDTADYCVTRYGIADTPYTSVESILIQRRKQYTKWHADQKQAKLNTDNINSWVNANCTASLS